jgi:hypothetical protein
MIDVTEILKARPHVARKILAPLVAAAAVAALLVPTVMTDGFRPEAVDHRDAAVEVPAAPTPLAPVGDVAEAGTFVWTRVPGADRYRVTLFNATGTVLWEATTVDSSASLPDPFVLEPGRTHLWKVEARVGWDVWESSGLIEFEPRGVAAPPDNPGR